MDVDILREMGEWMAAGFYASLQAGDPWPVPYGKAFRCLYEHMEVRVPADRNLIPFEPLPTALTRESHGAWCATSLILDFDHNQGLRLNPSIAEERQQAFPQHAAFIDSLVADLRRRLVHFGGYTHSNPDMRRVVNEGFLAMEEELDRELARVAAQGEAAPPGERNLLAALKEYAAGVKAFHARTARALAAAAEAASGERRERLTVIAAAFARCFLRPSQSFVEGLLAVNFAWVLDGCDSIGRPDQVLGAHFGADLERGRLDLELARLLLDELWQAFERLNGWNLQLGGYTPEGRDGCNALTLECLRACARNRVRRPNAALRITRHTPDHVLAAALEVLRDGSGRPALYNDDLYIESLLRMGLGLTPGDAREVGFGGCTETMIAGLSNVGSLEGELNLAAILELALHDGFNPVSRTQQGPHTGRFEDFADFTAFLAALKRQIQYATDSFVARDREQLARRFAEGDPKLYRTMFTRDCVRRHKSFEAGGARYNWAVVSYQGVANLIDSLAAVRQCVFVERSLAAADLMAALRGDFQGHEAARRQLRAAPKFGNDDPDVDALGREIIGFAWEELARHETPRGGRYLPSVILFVTYQGAGRQVGATPDGRRAFDVLTDSVGAAQGCDRQGPTALLKSVTALPLWRAVGTPVLNVRFQRGILEGEENLRRVAALIRAYFAQGGMQLQISVLDSKAMREAQREPEKHADLIVRIGGYSERFTMLTRELQDSVIARTEHGI